MQYADRIQSNLVLCTVLTMSVALAELTATRAEAKQGSPPGMVWIPGGEFTMGSTDKLARRVEQPPHRVKVDGFWMDKSEVTNAQFREFAEATGYVTVAERKPQWEDLKKQVPPGTPEPPHEMLVAGSMVFTPPDRSVSLRNPRAWWSWVSGANLAASGRSRQ